MKWKWKFEIFKIFRFECDSQSLGHISDMSEVKNVRSTPQPNAIEATYLHSIHHLVTTHSQLSAHSHLLSRLPKFRNVPTFRPTTPGSHLSLLIHGSNSAI